MIDVVAAVIKKNNLYFIAQRNRNKHFAFCWEFPGGKVENQETFENALKREIKEELGIIPESPEWKKERRVKKKQKSQWL